MPSKPSFGSVLQDKLAIPRCVAVELKTGLVRKQWLKQGLPLVREEG
jgi:hypothetical protein